jgi:hypothetical protein
MKKLALLTIILFTTLSSFSQTVTKTDSIVPLKLPTAKLVIKDLLTGDGAKAELVEANKVIGLKDQQIGLLNQKDSLKEQKITNLTLMFDKATQQRDLEREKADGLLKELKVQKFKTAVYKAGTGAAIITTVLYLLKK